MCLIVLDPGFSNGPRHGARLDASDKTWRDNAQRPYDTPLSYGGWLQCQMLGSRIASELRSLDIVAKLDSPSEPAKRRKIIIHSSPYLRCVQTAVAISAGLREQQSRSFRTSVPTVPSGSQLAKEIKEEDDQQPDASRSSGKPLLRLDNFLEEWRSAGYFENTMRPAESSQLLADAKEFLRAPAEAIKGADLAISPPIQELSAIDWNEKKEETITIPTHEKTGLRQQLSKRARHLSDVPSSGRPARLGHSASGYSAPVPTYAIAPADAIPVGFVAHARDACLDVDYDWDSCKIWGDGGVWDEEWGLMHRRVSSGVKKMVSYYADVENGEEVVLILVTHQACCNALIRSLTGAPALHDIGTSSLTMAVRRAGPAPEARNPMARRGSTDLGLAQDYEMKIVASTEHLRGGSNPLGLNSPRLGRSPALASRRIVGADSPEGFSLGDPWRPQTAMRSFSHRSSEADAEPPIPNGLWRSGSQKKKATEDAVEVEPPTNLWKAGDSPRELPLRGSYSNLWSDSSSIRRDRSPGKRRWTAVDATP